jgi:uncharacterized protein YecT (DUF1311 family)
MKPIAVLISSFLLVSSFSLVSHAQDGANPQIDCTQTTTPTAINVCAQKQATERDRRLKTIYGELQDRFTDRLRQGDNTQINSIKKQYQQLISEQKAWLVARDKTCKSERTQGEGGSITSSVYYNCITKLTDRRIAILEKYRQDHFPPQSPISPHP